MVFKDNVKQDIFTSNANVTKTILRSAMSARDFARSSIEDNKNTLLNYVEISRDEEFNVVVGDQMQQTILILFEGKEIESEPTIRIIQAYAVRGSDAYIVTAAYQRDEGELVSENAKNIVKSFKLK